MPDRRLSGKKARVSIRDVTVREADAVVELRRYTLHPGARESLIELFDRELVETQEAVGMRVLGQFRDLDDPNAFVWLRGFESMPARAAGLEAFYGGPVWRAHRDAANATMIDSDDVLLLRPATSGSGLALDSSRRPPPGAESPPPAMIAATICPLTRSGAAAFPTFFERELDPRLRATGADVVAAFATEHSANNYPPLPIREEAEVFVWLARFPDAAAHADHLARLDLSSMLPDHVDEAPTTMRLTPTSRSLLR
jgi:quinol monooxygenase YgiN